MSKSVMLHTQSLRWVPSIDLIAGALGAEAAQSLEMFSKGLASKQSKLHK